MKQKQSNRKKQNALMSVTMKYQTIYLMTLIMLVVSACQEENKHQMSWFDNGCLIANEGLWGKSNASVSFYSYSGDSIQNDIFSRVNSRPLGDVLMHICLDDEKAYLVVNSSNKIEIVNRYDFSEAGEIDDLDNPRYMAIAEGKGFVSQWGGDGSVKVIDLRKNRVINTIDTGTGPEGILQASGYIWVANSGGYGNDSTVMIIDPETEQVTDTIQVGDTPKEMVADKDGNIWVLCYGKILYDDNWNIASETPSKLVKISKEDLSIAQTIVIATDRHPSHLDIDPIGNTLYFGGGYSFAGIYKMDVTTGIVNATPVVNETFYAFNVHPVNGEIFAMQSTDFTIPGSLKRYQSNGTFIKSYELGIGPNFVAF